jgi:hypothetical protein
MWNVLTVIVLALYAAMHQDAVAVELQKFQEIKFSIAAAICTSKGRAYPERTQAEGSSPDNLCLPLGRCPTASIVLPVYRCSQSQWRCIRNCPY